MKLGWQVVDPDGNVVDSGEAVVIEIDLLEEIQQYGSEGNPSWPE